MSITMFTDGSSRGNPGPGGFGVVISYDGHIVELGGREEHTTNNRMELAAAIEGLIYIKNLKFTDRSITAYSDSKYVIQGITSWVFGWQKNGWKTTAKKEVENRDLWEQLVQVSSGLSIDWKYVAGHAGHSGNERCDEIATSYADENPTQLFVGSQSSYFVDLSKKMDDSVKVKTSKKSSSKKAYSYVSLVKGIPMVHSTWAECEKRVKGVSGVKFQKVFSKDEESAILAGWKVGK